MLLAIAARRLPEELPWLRHVADRHWLIGTVEFRSVGPAGESAVRAELFEALVEVDRSKGWIR